MLCRLAKNILCNNAREPVLLFKVQVRYLRLLRLKASKSETDKSRFAPEMDVLLAGLIAIDPASSNGVVWLVRGK